MGKQYIMEGGELLPWADGDIVNIGFREAKGLRWRSLEVNEYLDILEYVEDQASIIDLPPMLADKKYEGFRPQIRKRLKGIS